MKNSDRKNQILANSSMTLGVEFIAIVGAFIAAGYWLDHKTGSLPGFTITGLVVGFTGGLYRLISQVKRINQQIKSDSQKSDSDNSENSNAGK